MRDKEIKLIQTKNFNHLQEAVIAMIYNSYFEMLHNSTVD